MADVAPGIVFLVGAGPGDPGLLTLRGHEVLCTADLVVHDSDIDARLLSVISHRAEKVPVGIGRSSLTMEHVQELLVSRARAGRRVVRLRTGDPYLSGRGSEEALHCIAQGVPFEVVPGVPSASASPARAGIPLLQAGLSGSVAFVRGPLRERRQSQPGPWEISSPPEEDRPRKPGITVRRRKRDKSGPDLHIRPPALRAEDSQEGSIDIDWPSLCAGVETLVFFCVEGQLELLQARLREGGRAAEEPLAFVSRGTTSEQVTIITTVGEMIATLTGLTLPPPHVIVVGDVVNLHDLLETPGARALFGMRVGVAGTRIWPPEWQATLRAQGAAVYEYPVSAGHAATGLSEELRLLADDLRSADALVYTSSAAVQHFCSAAREAGIDWRLFQEGCQVVAIGEQTTAALSTAHLRSLTLDAPCRPADLVAALAPPLRDKRVLIICDRLCDPEMLIELRQSLIRVTEVPVCEETHSPAAMERLLHDLGSGHLDVLLFDTPAAVTHVFKAVEHGSLHRLVDSVAIASMDEATTHALLERGVTPDFEPEVPNGAALAKVLAQWRHDPKSVSMEANPLPTDDDEDW